MKKWIALLLAAAAVLTFAACGKKEDPEETLFIPPLTETPALTEAPVIPDPESSADAMPTDEVTPVTEAAVPVTEPVTEPISTETAETAAAEETKSASFELDDKFKKVDETVYATRKVNIRKEPAVNSDSPGQLPKDDSVKRVGVRSDGWSAVIYDDQLYYIASEYLTTKAPHGNGGGSSQSNKNVQEEPAEGIVYTNHVVNFRKGPSAKTEWLAQIPLGAALKRQAVCSNGWVKVEYEGKVGYVAGGYVTDTAPESK